MDKFLDMKKKAGELIKKADEGGYEFNAVELSLLSKVGRAESSCEISPYFEEMFYKFYPVIKKRIFSKK